MSNSVEQYWYRKPERVPFWLKLVSLVFRFLAFIRRLGFVLFFFRVYRAKVPVIVVGNINVGGTGKTPFVAWLVQELKKAGLQPGIVSRGYGGNATSWPQQVRPDSDTTIVGDEAVLLARHCQCPMAVGPERVAAIKQLLKFNQHVDVVISDDGMQHYAMGRDIEIAVIDGKRRFGNGYCLPAGPLREPVSRLEKVNFRVTNGGRPEPQEHAMKLNMLELVNVLEPEKTRTMASMKGMKVHAVAGIGNPQRFFDQLKEQGMDLEEHPFADHHPFQEEDFSFGDKHLVLMTEKDAVKCERFAKSNFWYVRINAEITSDLSKKILSELEKKLTARKHRWTTSYSTS